MSVWKSARWTSWAARRGNEYVLDAATLDRRRLIDGDIAALGLVGCATQSRGPSVYQPVFAPIRASERSLLSTWIPLPRIDAIAPMLAGDDKLGLSEILRQLGTDRGRDDRHVAIVWMAEAQHGVAAGFELGDLLRREHKAQPVHR